MPAAGRPDLHILARFLDRMGAPGAGSFSRSKLQRAVGLNYDLFRKYLDILLERNLIERTQGKTEAFKISQEGQRIRAELLAWLSNLFGGRL
jgi:predicted transcriptional regulator